MINKLAFLAWLGLSAFLTFPLAVTVHPALAGLTDFVFVTQAAAPQDRGSFSILLPLAIIVTAFAFPSRIRSFGAAGWKNTIKTAAIWTVGAIVLWCSLLFLTGSIHIIDGKFLITVGIVQTVLTLFAIIVRLGNLPNLAALAAATAILVLSSSRLHQASAVSAARDQWQALSDTVLTGPLVVILAFFAATAVSFMAARNYLPSGNSSWRRAARTFLWIAASHVLWIFVLILLGRAEGVPRWLPVLTASAMALVGVAVPLAYHYRRGTLGLGPLVYNPERSQDEKAWPYLVSGTQRGWRRAWIISYTGVSNEPRVLRQCEALLDAGWEVVVCGFEGHSNRPDEWTFVRLPSTEPFRNSFHTVLRNTKELSHLLLRWSSSIGAFRRMAHVAHGTNPLWLHIRRTLTAFAKEHPELRADLVIAHDYHTSDVGYAIAKHYGAKFSIDVHEYAREQYSNDPQWVKREQPVITEMQDFYLRRADVVTVVCEGIANLLAQETPLQRPPVVIRNVPFKNIQAFRPVGERIKVLYHGDLSRPREIHTAIASMRLWRDDIDLVLRGSGDRAYIADLKRLAERNGVSDRVFFEDAVPFTRIVPAANTADIGFFSYSAYSPQIRFSLPNKFFEYVMAGLAVCSNAEMEEVARVVERYGIGKLSPRHTPDLIAETINSFTREEIDAFKKASLRAAEELNWEAERGRLIEAYEAVFKGPAQIFETARAVSAAS